MVSTRAAKTGQQTASGRASDMYTQHTPAELHVEGSEALRGGKVERKPAFVKKYRGVTYEIDQEGGNYVYVAGKKRAASEVATPPPVAKKRRVRTAQPDPEYITVPARPSKKRAADELEAPVPVAKRRRLQAPRQEPDNIAVLARASKKRKRDDSTSTGDAGFLAETVRQLKRVKVPKPCPRQDEIQDMLPYLGKMRPASRQHIQHSAPETSPTRGKAPDAYQLDPMEAKRLFRSKVQIAAPVFIDDSAPALLDEESDTRPIEQMLDWLQDPTEMHAVDDLATVGRPTMQMTVSEIQQHFLEPEGPQLYPWNLREIPFPMPAPAMPSFLRDRSCNLLPDIMRYSLWNNINEICSPECPDFGPTAENCPTHFMTGKEAFELEQNFKHWRGTVMLSEPGALTENHFDTDGFATFISCYEGEIGLAWLSNPTPDERVAGQHGVEASNRWCCKILRPGNTVYMSPGTRHLVFRQPEGNQTLATAVRVLRYCDVAEWLQVLTVQLEHTFADDDDAEGKVEFARVARGLVAGVEHLIDEVEKGQRLEKFGGQKTVELAEDLIVKVNEGLKRL